MDLDETSDELRNVVKAERYTNKRRTCADLWASIRRRQRKVNIAIGFIHFLSAIMFYFSQVKATIESAVKHSIASTRLSSFYWSLPAGLCPNFRIIVTRNTLICERIVSFLLSKLFRSEEVTAEMIFAVFFLLKAFELVITLEFRLWLDSLRSENHYPISTC